MRKRLQCKLKWGKAAAPFMGFRWVVVFRAKAFQQPGLLKLWQELNLKRKVVSSEDGDIFSAIAWLGCQHLFCKKSHFINWLVDPEQYRLLLLHDIQFATSISEQNSESHNLYPPFYLFSLGSETLTKITMLLKWSVTWLTTWLQLEEVLVVSPS